MSRIYKILPRAEWTAAQSRGAASRARRSTTQDGFIHFSTAAQAGETARRYFAGQADLVVLEVEGDDLGDALKWEPSRGGDLFPHLYGAARRGPGAGRARGAAGRRRRPAAGTPGMSDLHGLATRALHAPRPGGRPHGWPSAA